MNAREPENRKVERLPDERLLSVVATIRELDADLGLVEMPAESTARSKETLSELLERCVAVQREAALQLAEPVRSIHHFACTGGTLISKCLAAMPNVSLLSEVDPLSELLHSEDHRFHPTDLVELMRLGSRRVGDELLKDVFLEGLRKFHDVCTRSGVYLVLRDHAHSHFCFGASIPERPTLRELVEPRFPVLSVVTVRHPLDSYLSLAGNGWRHFTPQSVEEYARRYLAFLDAYAGLPLYKYEDFVADPDSVMKKICKDLALSFDVSFKRKFAVFRLSGDSGRQSKTIESRPRRSLNIELIEEVAASASMGELCRRLEYTNSAVAAVREGD